MLLLGAPKTFLSFRSFRELQRRGSVERARARPPQDVRGQHAGRPRLRGQRGRREPQRGAEAARVLGQVGYVNN